MEKKSKIERRKFLQKIRKNTPFEWDKWGISLPLIVDGPPERLLNFHENRVIEQQMEKAEKILDIQLCMS